MKKREQRKLLLFLVLRYLLLLVLGIFLALFYKIFLLPTILPSYFLLNLFYKASVLGNIISVGTAKIEIIGACVAGSAYYLLLILNLTTRMKIKQRVYALLFSFLSLLILNILRIFFLSVLFIENFAFFDFTHKLFWYSLSALFVVGIWFLAVRTFRIKNIPVYSDFKTLSKEIYHP